MPLPSIDDRSTRRPAASPLQAPFTVHYFDAASAQTLLANQIAVLGVVGYSTERPAFLLPSVPFIAAPLASAAGDALFEIWTAASPTRFCQHGIVTAACSDDILFGGVTLAEDGNTSLETIVETAYRAIFDCLDATGFAVPIRFWNYLTSILADDRGLERYRRFNIGRHQAFTARLRQPVPPAASGVGGHHGASIIYFLAAREPARAIENPRQVSAYEYPSIYGPRSPSFSRASVYTQAQSETLFISGTASIVGHETRHLGDLSGQIAETAENLRALIEAARQTAPVSFGPNRAVKIYLHDPADQETVSPTIDAVFGAESQRVYLHGDICRPGLLLEIEAFCQSR